MEPSARKRQAARTPLAQFRCVRCRYGASRNVAPDRCPMCGGTVWEHESRRPFAHPDTSRAGPAQRHETEDVRVAPIETPRASNTETYREAVKALQPEDLVDHCVRLYTRIEQLETALQSRIVIEQAKGVLAERMQLQLDEAFELLRLAARSERRKIQLVAKQVVDDVATPQAIIRAIAKQQRWRALGLREHNEAVQEHGSEVQAAMKEQTDRLTRKPQRSSS